uniref:Transmembrane protein 79b n=1 Tax=Mastacembelus armatus TaxID=205130 RepID=A0A7N8XWE8_9TELE
MEPSTLQWTRDRQADGQTGGQPGRGDRMSVRSSEAASWTESERELAAEGLRKEGGGGEGRGKGEEEEADPQTHLGGGEEPVENHLPEKAAQVFSPAMSIQPCPLTTANMSTSTSGPRTHLLPDVNTPVSTVLPFLPSKVLTPVSLTCLSLSGRCGCPSRDVLKVGVSLMMSALLFPFLVWGGFVFLPFDAPLMDGAPLRLVYTLRCSVFAAVPIILGWLVLGVTRIRSGALRPLFDDEVKEAEHHEVTVHRRFISDSASLFLMYFLQLVVMAMYLSQQNLKLVPLLTVIFAFGRLVYWVAAAFGSSIRGFGFGLSFLPSLTMMVANIYFIFTLEAAGSIFSLPSPPEEELTLPAGKQRFWG